jgi:ribokinase
MTWSTGGLPPPSVVVVGQVARDLVLVVDQLPGPGSSVEVARRRELLGGKGANIAVGLAQLGVPVALVGVVGDDLAGQELLAQCERDHIDTTALRRRAGTESALMVDIVTADGQWRYLESVPTGALLTPDDIEGAAGLLGDSPNVILQLQQPGDAILTAIDRLDSACRVILDGVPEDVVRRDRILAAGSVLRLDAHEAELLAGHPIPNEATARIVAADLLARGPDLVVLAVGGDGNLVAWPEGAVLLPLVRPDAVVDTTGGGDAFVAALAWALDRGEDQVRAGQLATAAAGLVVQHPGGRPALDAATVETWADQVGVDR